jgi:ribosomal protein L44E
MAASNRHFFANQLIVMAISFGISIVISIIIPFPISLAVIVGVFILLNFYMRNRMMRKMGMGTAGRGIFNSMSSSGAGSSNSSLKYYCMSCGTQHTRADCPNCGSRMKKVEF